MNLINFVARPRLSTATAILSYAYPCLRLSMTTPIHGSPIHGLPIHGYAYPWLRQSMATHVPLKCYAQSRSYTELATSRQEYCTSLPCQITQIDHLYVRQRAPLKAMEYFGVQQRLPVGV